MRDSSNSTNTLPDVHGNQEFCDAVESALELLIDTKHWEHRICPHLQRIVICEDSKGLRRQQSPNAVFLPLTGFEDKLEFAAMLAGIAYRREAADRQITQSWCSARMRRLERSALLFECDLAVQLGCIPGSAHVQSRKLKLRLLPGDWALEEQCCDLTDAWSFMSDGEIEPDALTIRLNEIYDAVRNAEPSQQPGAGRWRITYSPDQLCATEVEAAVDRARNIAGEIKAMRLRNLSVSSERRNWARSSVIRRIRPVSVSAETLTAHHATDVAAYLVNEAVFRSTSMHWWPERHLQNSATALVGQVVALDALGAPDETTNCLTIHAIALLGGKAPASLRSWIVSILGIP